MLLPFPSNGKIQVHWCQSQFPSKALKQADKLLWSIPESTTHWLWISGAFSHKQILAANLCYIAFDLCFQLEEMFLAHFPALLYCCLHAISISQLYLISRLLFLRVSFSFVESGSDSKTRDNMDTYRAPQPFVLG